MVKEFAICPICGHKRWCGSALGRDGSELYFCHYQAGPKGAEVIGIDGNIYIAVKENANGDGWILVTKEQRDKERKEWAEAHPKVCPVCESLSGCGTFASKNDPSIRLISCKGIRAESGYVTGKDGNVYRVIKRKEGKAFLERKEDYLKEQEQYRKRRDWVLPNGEVLSGNKEGRTAPIVMERPVHSAEKSILRSNEELHRVYQSMIRHLKLLPKHRKLLIDSGWTDAMIREYQVVSMPLPDKIRWHLEKEHSRSEYLSLPWRVQLVEEVQADVGEDLSGSPGFYTLDTVDKETGEILPKWRLAGANGILFFSRDIKKQTFGAQIRKDEVREGQSRYTWLSSNPEIVGADGRPLYKNGTGQPVQASIIYHPERDQSYVAYVTEGFKKGVLGNYYKKAPFITLPGVGQTNAILSNRDESLILSEYLKRIGTKIVIFAFDADKVTNRNVLRFQLKGLKQMKEEGFEIGVADWTAHAAYAKGIDDLLTQGLDCEYELITEKELKRMEEEIQGF